MKALAASGMILLAAAASGAAALPLNLRHGEVRVREVGPGRLSAEIRTLGAGPAAWIGWSAPLADRRSQMCCFGSVENFHTGGGDRPCCGSCALDGGRSALPPRSEPQPVPLEEPDRFTVFVRAAAGIVERVRVFSLDCEIDAGGAVVSWLNGVSPAEGIALLESLANGGAAGAPTSAGSPRPDDEDEEPGPGGDRLVEPALSAIAFHDAPEADRALERLVARDHQPAIRKKAAFWLGNSRRRAGFEILQRAVAGDPDAGFRKNATFALSQSPVPEALAALIGMARRDPSGEVRGQALFWLAQKAGRKAAAAVENAIADDPDTEVKKKAVFALAQMPAAAGVPDLIRVARTNRNPEVRRQAIFWLGQSRDSRALAFLEEVLTR